MGQGRTALPLSFLGQEGYPCDLLTQHTLPWGLVPAGVHRGGARDPLNRRRFATPSLFIGASWCRQAFPQSVGRQKGILDPHSALV